MEWNCSVPLKGWAFDILTSRNASGRCLRRFPQKNDYSIPTNPRGSMGLAYLPVPWIIWEWHSYLRRWSSCTSWTPSFLPRKKNTSDFHVATQTFASAKTWQWTKQLTIISKDVSPQNAAFPQQKSFSGPNSKQRPSFGWTQLHRVSGILGGPLRSL